jgi:hypothetical protein
MKIKITEGQAKRLGLINENADPLVQYEQYCSQLVPVVEKMYQQVINITVDDLLNKRVNMEELNKKLDSIESAISDGSRKAYAFINNSPEEDLDVRIDKAHDLVMDKLTPLQLVTMDLERLQNSSEMHRLTEPFKHIKPLDITDMQNSQ